MDNSTFLSLAGYRITDATSTAEAYGFSDGASATAGFIYNVALMLDRVADPTEMLAGTWASRQTALAASDLWSSYGADPTKYQHVLDKLVEAGLTVIDANTAGNDGYYTSSVDNRTIWVQLTTADQFNTLFGGGDQIIQYSPSEDLYYWDTDLVLPEDWDVVGLWFDTSFRAPATDLGTDPPRSLDQGAQSPGNSGTTAPLKPQDIADRYNFPLDGQEVSTGIVGLIEPGIGTYLWDDPLGMTFQSLLDEYRNTLGTVGTGQVSAQGLNGQDYAETADMHSLDALEERSADVGVVAAVNPNSDIQLFNGSGGTFQNAQASTFSAIQASIWNPAGSLPAVTPSSWMDLAAPVPNSPYWIAYQQLYIDAALKNQTTVIAAMDGGSSAQIPNGLTNVNSTQAQPYNLLVGGTSLSGQATAMTDPTLLSMANSALQGDRDMLWRMMMSGLTTLPSVATDINNFLETVWNLYTVSGDTISGYTVNSTGAGGVDVTQGAPPSYQTEYGLNPISADSLGGSGRGVPDVSARAGGNMAYWVPAADMYTYDDAEDYWFYGTSVAAPLWASLDHPVQLRLQRPGAPESRLHERSALHRLGDRTGLVQRHHHRQQQLDLLLRYVGPLSDRRLVGLGDRHRLLGRARLRLRDRSRYAEWRVAGARAHRHRTHPEFVSEPGGRARLRRHRRLDEWRRPVTALPDGVIELDGCGHWN